MILLVIILYMTSLLLGFQLADLDLPKTHLPYYFNSLTKSDYLTKCQSPTCTVKESDIRCWGYEDTCSENKSFERPKCPGSSRGWVKTKKEQLETFYNQADFGYIRNQRKSIQVLCKPSQQEDSNLECSDHLEFCRGRNLFVNFTSLNLRTQPFRYKMDVLSPGDISGQCTVFKSKIKEQLDRLSPLQSWGPEIQNFQSSNVVRHCDIIENTPTYFMKIDAAVNMYHHMCDFINLYSTLHVNNSNFNKDVQIVIWETYPYYSSFSDMWLAFTNRPLRTLDFYKGKTVCFKDVLFPLLPRMIFGLFYNTPLVNGCEKSGLFKAFSEFTLHRLRIPISYPNNKIRVSFLSRETSHRNIINEMELIKALSNEPNVFVQRVVFNNKAPFRGQLRTISNTDLLIGMHGAGLTHLLFLPDWAAVFEVYNCEDPSCYKDLASLRGVKYATWEGRDGIKALKPGIHPTDGSEHAKFTNYSFEVNIFLKTARILIKQIRDDDSFKKGIHDEL